MVGSPFLNFSNLMGAPRAATPVAPSPASLQMSNLLQAPTGLTGHVPFSSPLQTKPAPVGGVPIHGPYMPGAPIAPPGPVAQPMQGPVAMRPTMLNPFAGRR